MISVGRISIIFSVLNGSYAYYKIRDHNFLVTRVENTNAFRIHSFSDKRIIYLKMRLNIMHILRTIQQSRIPRHIKMHRVTFSLDKLVFSKYETSIILLDEIYSINLI